MLCLVVLHTIYNTYTEDRDTQSNTQSTGCRANNDAKLAGAQRFGIGVAAYYNRDEQRRHIILLGYYYYYYYLYMHTL